MILFLLEIFFNTSRKPYFYTGTGMPLQLRSDASEEEIQRIITWFDEFETIMTAINDNSRLDKVKSYMDIQSQIDIFLVNELMGNHDAFLYSTYLFKLKDSLLTWGPVWDFDQSAGITKYTHETDAWMLPFRRPPTNAGIWYFQTLLKHPEFYNLVQQRWHYLHRHVPALLLILKDYAKELNDAQQRNFSIWPILDQPVMTNIIVFDTYEEAVNHLINWLERRDHWINANLEDLFKGL